MKRTFILLLIALPFWSLAQNTEGKIVYEEKMNMHVNFEMDGQDDAMMEQLKAMMPEYRTSQRVLHFTEAASVYKNYDGGEGPEEMKLESEGMSFHMKFDEPENILFKDLAESRIVHQQEFFTRKFLIKDDMEASKWKLTGESKEVLGYMCQQATMQTEKDTLIAWFAPEIPVSSGPSKYGQLPGMILELDSNGGKLVISAKSITLEAADKKQLEEPKKGKVVTREEFKQLVEEKQKEMQMEMGGSGGNRIIIRN